MKLNPGLSRNNSIRQEKSSFHQQIGIKFKEFTGEVLNL